MNYKIIADENKFLEFINWLPELNVGETFYCALLARNKYLADRTQLKADKCGLKSFTATKEQIFDKVRQLEVMLGAYKYKGTVVPQEALAMYIMPNPRSLEKATRELILKLQKLSWAPYNGYNPHKLALSEIQKACGRTLYFDFDFDYLEPEKFVEYMVDHINLEALHVLKTRGGFHALVDVAKVKSSFTKSWYKSITSMPNFKPDTRGDELLPTPGCVQGDFIPYFI